MSLTASEIADVVAELRPLLGSRIGSVWVHGERALTLELHGRAGETLLLVSAEPDRTRIHAASRRPAQPASPLPFQAVLRREILGARLSGMTSIASDRVVSLRLEGVRGPVELLAELTGRHGNIFLLGADGKIQASAGKSLSQGRRLVPGEHYEPPRLPPKTSGAPPGAARPCRFTPREDRPFPLSAAVEAEYDRREEERRLAEGRRRLREPLRAALARSARALEKLAEEALRVPQAEEDRRRADLLKANLHLVRRGAREVTVTEWTEEGPRQVRLALDPALAPQANMARYYRRYRRIVDSAARVTARTDEVRHRKESLGALLRDLEQANLAALPRLERDARRLGAGPRRAALPRRRDEPAPPFRSFRSLQGVAILVGRGAAQNDALTLRVARGNDLWLHARGRAGAHVVVRLKKSEAPDQETLLDAAHLAAHFSDSRGEPQVEVAYTRAKYVRKPRGSAPGAVTFSQERTLLLRVEPQRLERLLAEEEDEETPALSGPP